MYNLLPTAHVVQFTGEESDRFVSFAQHLLRVGETPHVDIVAWAPATKRRTRVLGTVRSAIWEQYRRKLVVENTEGTVYEVAGSNASSSFSAESVVFLDVPPQHGGVHLDDNAVRQACGAFRDIPADRATCLYQLIANVAHIRGDDAEEVANVLLNIDGELPLDIQTLTVDLLALLRTGNGLQHLIRFSRTCHIVVRRRIILRCRVLASALEELSPDLQASLIDLLIENLLDDDEDVRSYSAEALGYVNLGTTDPVFRTKVIPALLSTFQSGQGDMPRWSAAIALGKLNDDRILPAMIAALDDKFNRIRAAAIIGLTRWPERIGPRMREVHDRLKNMLEADDTYVRPFAAAALGTIYESAEHAVAALLGVCRIEAGPTTLASILAALVQIVDRVPALDRHEAVSALTALAKDVGLLPPRSPFYPVVLEYGGELAYLLEAHSVAAEFYRQCAGVSTDIWRRRYYHGISRYELAELLCTSGEGAKAVTLFEEAEIELGGESDRPADITPLIESKKIAIRCRAALQRGVVALANSIYAPDFNEAARLLKNAERQYDAFDLNRGMLQPTQPAESDVFLLKSLQLCAHVASEIASLLAAGADTDTGRLQETTRLLTIRLQRADNWVRHGRSRAVQRILTLAEEIFPVIDDHLAHGRRAETFTELDRLARAFGAFSAAMPAQECPTHPGVTGDIEVTVPGKRGNGSGRTRESPLVFLSGNELLFDVRVSLTAEQIKGSAELTYSATGGQTQSFAIPMIDRPWPIVVDGGAQSPGFIAVPHTFELSVRTYSRVEAIATKTVWIQVLPANASTIPDYMEVASDGETESAVDSIAVVIGVAQVFAFAAAVDHDTYTHSLYDEVLLARGRYRFRLDTVEPVHAEIHEIIALAAKESCALVVFPACSLPAGSIAFAADLCHRYGLAAAFGLDEELIPSVGPQTRTVLIDRYGSVLNIFTDAAATRLGGPEADGALLKLPDSGVPHLVRLFPFRWASVAFLRHSLIAEGEGPFLSDVPWAADLVVVQAFSVSCEHALRWMGREAAMTRQSFLYANHTAFGGSSVASTSVQEGRVLPLHGDANMQALDVLPASGPMPRGTSGLIVRRVARSTSLNKFP